MPDESSGTRLRPDPSAGPDSHVAAEFLDDAVASERAEGSESSSVLDEAGETAVGDVGSDADVDADGFADRQGEDDGAETSTAEDGAGRGGRPVPAVRSVHPVIRHGRELAEDRGPGFWTRMVAIVLAISIGLAGGVVALIWLVSRATGGLNPFEQSTVDRSGKPVLQALNDLATFQAAAGYYEIVIDQETDVANLPAFLAGERVIFVAAGSVDATVDFSGIAQGDVRTNAERTSVAVSLPAVDIGRPRLDLDRSYVADHQRGLRERLQDAVGAQGGGQNTEQLYLLADQRLAAAANATDDLKERARTNTRSMLTSLLNQVGFTQVTVTFADQ